MTILMKLGKMTGTLSTVNGKFQQAGLERIGGLFSTETSAQQVRLMIEL
jgi:hypothetical protein